MIEIDVSEIIAHMVVKETANGEITLSMRSLKRIADKLENERTTIYTTCDMLSVDAFRCRYSKQITVKGDSICIQKDVTFTKKMHRYLPSDDVKEILEKIIEEEK